MCMCIWINKIVGLSWLTKFSVAKYSLEKPGEPSIDVF